MSHKLKSIYDAIDHGNYKGALKLCVSVLQKQPQNTLCKALKAHILERLDRHDEALELCHEAKDAKGNDDVILNTLQVVYRRLGHHAEVSQMYEMAWEENPNEEDYGVQCFIAVARQGDYAKAQQVAMKLYRKFQKNKYLPWVIVSILLQVKYPDPDNKVLDLAAMMLKKVEIKQKDKFHRSSHYLLLLELSTLRQQKKTAEALERLESEDAKVLLPYEVDRTSVKCRLIIEGDPAKKFEILRQLVLVDVDNWGPTVEYIHRAFGGSAVSGALPTAEGISDFESWQSSPEYEVALKAESIEDLDALRADDEVKNMFFFFRWLQQREVAKEIGSRIPVLAELEMRKLNFLRREFAAASDKDWHLWRTVSQAETDAFMQAMIEFVRCHSRVGSCFSELRPYLCLLDGKLAKQFIDDLEGPGSDQKNAPELLTIARLRRGLQFIGEPPSQDSLGAEVKRLLSLWQEHRRSKKSGVSEADHFLCLAVVILIDLDRLVCQETQAAGRVVTYEDRQHIVEALALLEMGNTLATCPDCYAFRLLMLLLYGSIGDLATMRKFYTSLEIKNIMHESISFLLLDSLLALGWVEDSGEVCRQILQFHEDCDKEMGDVIGFALREGIFQRLPEYLDSTMAMARSAVRARATVESHALEVSKAPAFQEIVEYLGRHGAQLAAIAGMPKSHWSIGNQDRTMLVNYHPLPQCSPLASLTQYRPAGIARGLKEFSRTSTLTPRVPDTVCTSAMVWPLAQPAEASRSAVAAPLQSAIEDLLVASWWSEPGRLRLRAQKIEMLHLLLKGPAGSEDLQSNLAAFKETLAAEGLVEGSGRVALGMVRPWGPSPRDYEATCWRCCLLTLETATTVSAAIGSRGTWEDAEKSLEAVCSAVKDCTSAILSEASQAGQYGGEDGVSSVAVFGIGAQGVVKLSSFLHGPLLVLVPIAFWCSSNMPKAGGKKPKEGLQPARQALKSLFAAMQNSLSELQTMLTSAKDKGQAWHVGSTAPKSFVAIDSKVCDFGDFLGMVREKLETSHGQQLQYLQENLTLRLGLLKQANFKA